MEKAPNAPFEFDLEKELKGNEKKCNEKLEMIEQKIHALKALLRSGAKEEKFETCKQLLDGYSALQTVINKLKNKL